jgi:hypothetical protein
MADRAGATEFVGAVVTLVALDAAVLAIAGPRFAGSITELTASRGWIVPAEQPVALTVKLTPLEASGAKVHPVAVPAFEKSPEARPETDSLRTKVKEIALDEFRIAACPDAGTKLATVGGT